VSDDRSTPDLDDEELGGEMPCWAHLLDDEGRMPEPAQATLVPASATPADSEAAETEHRDERQTA
jgi:hypothetical protein